jgi:hypothetical protein
VNLTNDVNHCRSCTKACGSGATCESSTCTLRYGYPSITTEGTATSFGSDHLLGEQIYIGSSIVVTKIAVNALASGPYVVMALYADSGGAPSALLASTSATTMFAGSNEIPVLAPANIPAGYYWIMAVYSADADVACDTATDNTYRYISLPFGTDLPNPLPFANYESAVQHFGYYVVGTQ